MQGIVRHGVVHRKEFVPRVSHKIRDARIYPAASRTTVRNLSGFQWRISWCEPKLGLRGLLFPIPRRRIRFERMQKPRGRLGNFIHSSLECDFVCLGRLAKAADFPHELQRSIPNLFHRHGRFKVEQNFDIPAHRHHLNSFCSGLPASWKRLRPSCKDAFSLKTSSKLNDPINRLRLRAELAQRREKWIRVAIRKFFLLCIEGVGDVFECGVVAIRNASGVMVPSARCDVLPVVCGGTRNTPKIRQLSRRPVEGWARLWSDHPLARFPSVCWGTLLQTRSVAAS
jgi:hypothetical protein